MAVNEGWGGIAEVPRVLGTLNLGLEIRFSAVNPGAQKVAIFKAIYRIVADGESMAAGGQTEADVYLVPIPAGAAVVTLDVFRQPTIRNARLADADQIILERFYRDIADAGDTFDGDVYINGFLFYWTSEDNPAW